jgi:hypothetical protein
MMLARFRTPALGITIGAAVMAPVLGLAVPAQAAATGHGGSGPAGAHARTLSVINNQVFAGYVATVAAGSATSSAAQYKLPKLSCTSANRAITPVAGVAVNNNNLATFSAAFVFTGCQKGKAVYFPALVINGNEVNYTTTAFHAGNVIKVATKVTTAGTTVSVTDTTTAVTKKRTGAGASSSSAYVGDSDWAVNGTILGVPSFGTLSFTNCLVDGKSLAASHPAKYQRVNGSTVQITTGALSSTGTSFPTHFKHS